jgi:hypothetical protein
MSSQETVGQARRCRYAADQGRHDRLRTNNVGIEGDAEGILATRRNERNVWIEETEIGSC